MRLKYKSGKCKTDCSLQVIDLAPFTSIKLAMIKWMKVLSACYTHWQKEQMKSLFIKILTREYVFNDFRERSKKREKHLCEKHRLVASHLNQGSTPKPRNHTATFGIREGAPTEPLGQSTNEIILTKICLFSIDHLIFIPNLLWHDKPKIENWSYETHTNLDYVVHILVQMY